MTQPAYVPVVMADQVRPAERLPAPRHWRPDRPGDVVGPGVGPGQPHRDGFGAPGPDQGYALKLAHRMEDRLELADGERAEDAVAGSVAVGLRRAALFGRAPVVRDLELAFRVWGLFGGAPEELVAHRRALFQGAADEYWTQRAIADAVPEETLRLSPDEARDRLGHWRELLRLAG